MTCPYFEHVVERNGGTAICRATEVMEPTEDGYKKTYKFCNHVGIGYENCKRYVKTHFTYEL